MALSFLLDTSVLTRLAKSPVSVRLGEIEDDNVALARCMMTDLEIGSSASNGKEATMLKAVLEAYVSVEVESQDFHQALELQVALAEAGLKGRKPPDLLIAAVALRLGLTVLHYDRDFEHIGSVSPLRHEWIVAAGSVD
jgi:predicted nucleic acid-binding protein